MELEYLNQLGVSNVSRLVLHHIVNDVHLAENVLFVLRDSFPNKLNFPFIKSSAFYNGRENSVCLRVNNGIDRTKDIFFVFGESRNSDQIFLDTWEGSSFNAPTVAEFPEKAYRNRRLWGNEEERKVAETVIKEIENYFRRNGELADLLDGILGV